MGARLASEGSAQEGRVDRHAFAGTRRLPVRAPGIVDLTDAAVRSALSLDRGEITVVANHFDLDAFDRPFAYELPQCVGDIANALGIGGLLYPSAPDSDGTCMVLFTDQLAAHGGWYEAEHPVTGDVERWPAGVA